MIRVVIFLVEDLDPTLTSSRQNVVETTTTTSSHAPSLDICQSSLLLNAQRVSVRTWNMSQPERVSSWQCAATNAYDNEGV